MGGNAMKLNYKRTIRIYRCIYVVPKNTYGACSIKCF